MPCERYPKIDTLFNRDENFKVVVGEYRRAEFDIPRAWTVTEKIDGTNVRVSLEQDLRCSTERCPGCDDCYRDFEDPIWAVRFYGRTENAQMPTFLLEHLQKTFTLDKMQSLWPDRETCTRRKGSGSVGGEGTGKPKYRCDCVTGYPITLYGEGYGAKIQKGGGNYRKDADVSFRLFDVYIGKWLERANVVDIAVKLGIKPVPQLNPSEYGIDVGWIMNAVRAGIESVVAEKEGTSGTIAEGVVAFTEPLLYNARGQRLSFKLKTKDF